MNLSPRRRRAFVAAFVFLVLYGVAGFFVLPPVIRVQAAKRLTAELGRAVSLGRVRVNPFALSLTLEDLDIRERDGGASFLGWARFYVRFDALASLTGDWVLGRVELDGFHMGVVVNPDGSFNFSDLLAKVPAQPPQASKPGRAVRIGSLGVAGARVDFSDHSLRRPFATLVGPLTFTLTDFRTAGSRGAPYHFDATTEAGERLAWSGTLSADPVASRGEFEVENLVLNKYSPYFEGMTRADLTDGTLSVSGHYEVDFDPARRVLALGDAGLHLRGLRVMERSGGKVAAEIKALDVSGLQADAVALRATAGRIALTGGHLVVRRSKDGSVNLLAMLKPADAAPAAPRALPAPAVIPKVAIGEIALDDSLVDIDDQGAPRPAQLSLGDIHFSLKKFSLAAGAAMPVHLTLKWAPKGAVKVDGTVVLMPSPEVDLKADVAGLEVLPLSPYLEQFIDARITRGAVTTAVSLQASISGGRPTGSIEGDASVDGFGLVDGARDEDLLGFSRLALTGLKAGTSPQLAVSIQNVDVSGPYARVRVNADKSLNIASVVKLAGPPAAAPAQMPRIEVGRVVIAGGDFSFLDSSVEPNVRVALSNFAGTISGLSSENLERADVGLKGMVGDAGPVGITGKLDPLGTHRFVGLTIDVTNVDLLPLSPYMGKYAGYEIARGQLVVASKILVDGDKVDAANVVTLNQFTFGAATSSPDATALPVRLGVALLKDTDGRIVIDLPVQGSLDNPEFRVGKVVLRVVVNLLTKAAISPFSLIGSMFGGGGDDLAFQEFAPGSSELQASELPKLGTLATALANRPALSLGIEGGYDAAADAYALRRSRLAALVRTTLWEERHAADPNIAPPGELVISPEENAAMVKKLFNSKFPPGTQFGAPLPQPPAVAPPPPGPPPGLLRRIVDAITFRRQMEERAALAESRRLSARREADVAKAAAAGLPLDQMTGRLAESMEVTGDDLGALASARAQAVRSHLIDAGHIAADRLFLAQGPDPAKRNKGPRVILSLQ